MQTLSRNSEIFIDEERLHALLEGSREDPARTREVIARSLCKEPLSVEECAVLLAARSPKLVEEIFDAARRLKRDVYGNRIVLFAPLYIGNHCLNDCAYCAFRRSLRSTVRKTLSDQELVAQVEALEDAGHKRLILVFGEHPNYTPEFIARTVRTVYSIRKGRGEIRRVNINAAPLGHDGFRTVKAAGIGTYQIFQETYHQDTYRRVHPSQTHKGDYHYRLDALSRAFEAGCDDAGIGALFGLYDWRFEVLGLVSHAIFLKDRYGCGPHTISFPRLRPAHGVELDSKHLVNDHDFKRLVAILRLCVPYTGLILTARETPEIRREVMAFGVSQIDAGTRVELDAYTRPNDRPDPRRGQFMIGDLRSLDEILHELLRNDYLPSFCTACYRLGRTGEHFMEYAIPGFIEQFCTPNALLTLAEYLEDYATPATRKLGHEIISRYVSRIKDAGAVKQIAGKLEKIQRDHARDLYL
jgi:2-iminoacetate synthase